MTRCTGPSVRPWSHHSAASRSLRRDQTPPAAAGRAASWRRSSDPGGPRVMSASGSGPCHCGAAAGGTWPRDQCTATQLQRLSAGRRGDETAPVSTVAIAKWLQRRRTEDGRRQRAGGGWKPAVQVSVPAAPASGAAPGLPQAVTWKRSLALGSEAGAAQMLQLASSAHRRSKTDVSATSLLPAGRPAAAAVTATPARCTAHSCATQSKPVQATPAECASARLRSSAALPILTRALEQRPACT